MSVTLAKNTSLLEILELPQLMETVVRNQHYEEALNLHSFVTKLCKKQPDVKLLADIQLSVTNSCRVMLQQLVSQLRSQLQLPQCLKVCIIHLQKVISAINPCLKHITPLIHVYNILQTDDNYSINY